MRRMRSVVKENNVYRWAGDLIGELAGIRLETPSTAAVDKAVRRSRRPPVPLAHVG
jgi:hypothetical protein